MALETKTQRKRAEIAQQVASHLIAEGFGDSGIRSLALSAGLSNRMLLYYFESKEEVLHEAVTFIADGLEDALEQLLPGRNLSLQNVFEVLVEASKDSEFKSLLLMFFELVGLSMRSGEPYKSLTQSYLLRWQKWLETKLRADQKHKAPELMARLEGRFLVDLVFDNP